MLVLEILLSETAEKVLFTDCRKSGYLTRDMKLIA
jgi:hypothetical protein